MIGKCFRTAMISTQEGRDYSQPYLQGAGKNHWIVVARHGHHGEHLTIGLSNQTADLTEPSAPEEISCSWHYCGLLFEESERQAEFLLLRNIPTGCEFSGTFAPTDGFAKLFLSSSLHSLGLNAFGRYAHTRENRHGISMILDSPNPPSSSKTAASWMMNAKWKPWIKQINLDEKAAPHDPVRSKDMK